jgi:predicted NAD/FAD-binding protein
MPAGTFLRFLANHGLLRLDDRPPWRTVAGGSRRYLDKALAKVDEVLLGTAVIAIDRDADSVSVTDSRGRTRKYDQLVMATHADTSLRVLGADATAAERRIMGAFRYAPNRAIIHSDDRLMPHRRSAWASWNVAGAVTRDAAHPVAVTYWMNRLQSLPPTRQVFVSLNPAIHPRPESVIDDVWFSHPQFDAGTSNAQRELGTIQGEHRTWFAGAYCGYGFHEDGLQAGLTVAAQLGSGAPWIDKITPRSPAASVVLRKRSVVSV